MKIMTRKNRHRQQPPSLQLKLQLLSLALLTIIPSSYLFVTASNSPSTNRRRLPLRKHSHTDGSGIGPYSSFGIIAAAQHQRDQRQRTPALTMRGGNSAGDAAVPSVRQVPKIIRNLNSSTKWLIALGSIVGVLYQITKYDGPYIVVGSIAAVYFTEVLKKSINQSRPANSPFADPGMPSSHACVSCFAAVGWISSLDEGTGGKIAILAAAATVTVLRVVCDFHTVAQIAAGTILGAALGKGWWYLGTRMHICNPKALLIGAWVAYLGGSAFFISTHMSKWTGRNKDL